MTHNDEYELIAHSHLADCSMFLVDLFYRPLHLHQELELCMVLSGSGLVSIQQQSFAVSEGDILLFDSGEAHELNGGERGLRLLALQVSRNFCKRYCPQLRSTRFPTGCVNRYFDAAGLYRLRRSMREAFAAYLERTMTGAFHCMAQINGLFGSLLANVPYQVLDQTQMLSRTKDDARVRRLLLYLEEHFREPVRLGELARMEGITEAHLSHFFRDRLHITFQDYLSHLRVEAAMYLLKTTDMSLTSVAYECGFSDPKYLNQSFRRILGVSPAQWRQSGRQSVPPRYAAGVFTMQHIFTEEESLRCLRETGSGLPGL